MEIHAVFEPTVQHPYGYIYVTHDVVNNKYYCGKHKATVFDTKYYGSGTLLKKSLHKHSPSNFICVPIDWAETAEELHQKEVQWIKHYNAVDDPQWYNLIEDSNRYVQNQQLLESKRTYKYPAEVPYIKMYLGEYLQNLNGLSTGCTEVLYQLLNYATYANADEPMTIYINSKNQAGNLK